MSAMENIPGLSGGKDSDAIKSETLNITKVMVAIATAIGAITTVSGANAPDPETTTAKSGEQASTSLDWAGFTQTGRTVIIVAVLAAAAAIVVADILARAIAAPRATAPKAPEGPTVLFRPRPVTRTIDDGPDKEGEAIAVRTGESTTVLFFDTDTKTVEWIAESKIKFRKEP
jgi:hypothetical protein